MSRRKGIAVAVLMAAIVAVSAAVTAFTGVSHTAPDGQRRIVASFYPVYIAALNVTDGVDGVSLTSLAGPQTGCLHDYQLTPDDRIALGQADALLLNGAGAESFLDDLLVTLPDLQTVDLSAGIDLLEEDEHEHEEHEDHDHANEHIWVSPARYAKQVENLRDGLCTLDPAHAAQYRANAAAYLEKIAAVQEETRALTASLKDTDAIVFHESLAYLADDLGLRVIAEIPIGEDTAVSAADLAQAERAVQPDRPLWLMYDSQYPTGDYDYLAKKAGSSRILTLDTAVRGAADKDGWLTAMREDLARMKGALS
ncbi:MAG: metal ABC transporter substrate-binding protein [Acutalibacteraceae bacterium]